MADEAVIRLFGIRKIYLMGDTTVKALDGVSLDIKKGEFAAVLGASGSGKSTLMNILGCLDKPTEGNYRFGGTDVESLDKEALAALRSRKIGFVFQSFNLLPRTTALENVELPLLYNTEVSSHQSKDRALAALEAIGLSDRAYHFSTQLSGGQQQRVAIARSIVNEPLLLLADEPTGNLDTRTSLEIMSIFQGLNRKKGMTVVLVTHEPDIAAYTNRHITFRDGLIISDTTVANPKNAEQELLALPPKATL